MLQKENLKTVYCTSVIIIGFCLYRIGTIQCREVCAERTIFIIRICRRRGSHCIAHDGAGKTGPFVVYVLGGVGKHGVCLQCQTIGLMSYIGTSGKAFIAGNVCDTFLFSISKGSVKTCFSLPPCALTS